jgi:hypothetical protein
MADVFARRIFGEAFVMAPVEPDIAPTPLPSPRRAGVLAVMAPLPDPLVDRLVVALGRALLKAQAVTRIVVFGACVDDLAVMGPSNVFVAGAVEADGYDRLVRQYEVSYVMSPYRSRFFGPVERFSRRFATPKVYFDYSLGLLSCAEEDLALDPRLCDEKAARQIADWLRAATDGAAGR